MNKVFACVVAGLAVILSACTETSEYCNGSTYDSSKKFCYNGVLYDILKTSPQEVTARVDFDDNYILVRWNQVSGADGYHIYRSASASGTYDRIGSVDNRADRIFKDNSKLEEGTTYYYRVAAYNVDSDERGTGPLSNYAPAQIPRYERFTDARDGTSYRTATIGGKTWMAQNLKYSANGSYCNDNRAYCEKYGRLYPWVTAMDEASSSNSNPSGVKGVCPAGWHLPSDEEWSALVKVAGGWDMAGTKLKSRTGWFNNFNCGYYASIDCNGTDDYEFSALPGGYRDDKGLFFANDYGVWWAATESETNASNDAYRVGIDHRELASLEPGKKAYAMSVRCVEDN